MDYEKLYKGLISISADINIKDNSFKAIVEEAKDHSVKRSTWIAVKRDLRKELFTAKHNLEMVEGKLVGLYKKHSSSAADVKLYAKYTLPLHPTVRKWKTITYRLESDFRFAEDIEKVLQQRGEILKKLMDMDKDMVITSTGIKHKCEDTVKTSLQKLESFLKSNK